MACIMVKKIGGEKYCLTDIGMGVVPKCIFLQYDGHCLELVIILRFAKGF